MDHLWIIILVIGAIVSITQKNQEKRRRTATEEGEEPSFDPRREWERRIRELLGEPAPAPAESEQQATPRTMTPKTDRRDDSLPPPHATMKSALQQQTATAAQRPHKSTATIKKTQPSPKSSTAPANDRLSGNGGRAQGAGNIIDDFDLERAVIYSEILKPKFEEY